MKNLEEINVGIYIFLSVAVTYKSPWKRFGNDDDDETDDVEPVPLHSGKLSIKNRDQMAEKLEKADRNSVENEGPIYGMRNLVIDPIGNACYKVEKTTARERINKI